MHLGHLSIALSGALIPTLALGAGPAPSTDPPWSAPLVRGVDVTVPGVDNVPDLHGDVNDPQLVILFAGNQYMLVNRLLGEFQKAHPEYRRVFAETLPPGILARQVEEGSLVIGNLRIQLQADIFTAGLGRMKSLQKERDWFSGMESYASNRLAIMTREGNPDHIRGWRDLARPDLRICMPNPKFEGIAEHAIIPALRAAGGNELVDAIYQAKVAAGTTYLTHIHHRQTPMRIMANECAAGAVWYTEAYFHAQVARHPTGMVTIADAHNKLVTYTAGVFRAAPHPEAAAAFMKFLTGPVGQALYRKYGFLPPPAAPSAPRPRPEGGAR